MNFANSPTERPKASITEVGTRDGFQVEPVLIPAEVKAGIIDAMIAAGLRHIEATSFVSPRAVPQLADAHDVLARLRRRSKAHIAALVPNVGDAEEIVQQTAVELWKKFDQYDAQQPFTPWACRFALNIVKQWVASRQRWQALLERDLAEELVNRREQLRPQFDNRLSHLDQCLEKLPPEQRGIVEAYYFLRQSIDAIAAETQRSVESVYKTLQRIRLLLRQCIEQAEQTGESFA